MRIPTVLALALLIILIAAGLLAYVFYEQRKEKLKLEIRPKNVFVANIDESQATIFWDTDKATSSYVLLDNKTFLDDRNYQPTFKKHMVTLKNLSPQTKYSFQIKSEDKLFSETNFNFITPKNSNTPSPQNSKITPLRTTLIDERQKPIEQALVSLTSDSFASLYTLTDLTGNFILPVNNLWNKDFTKKIDFKEGVTAKLTVTKDDLSSETELTLPLESNLLPITLGKEIVLYAPATSPNEKTYSKFDINKDGKINSLDVSQVIHATQNSSYLSRFDFNSDKKVDQKDVELINQSIR